MNQTKVDSLFSLNTTVGQTEANKPSDVKSSCLVEPTEIKQKPWIKNKTVLS